MSQHLIIAPILIPFVAGALMLLYDDRQRAAKFWLSLIATGLTLAVAVALLMRAKLGASEGAENIGFYLLGDWAAPMAIVLVLDHLAAMMLLLTSVLALASLVYARASWHRQGQHYFSLFQFLLVGLNGAFLTGDLFNLFVFFEVLLAASYGLLLHGSGQVRVRAGLHYIAINLAASLLLLLGISLIYGVTGTLNMAHLASMMPDIDAANRPLLQMGLALMGVAFLVKAGIWPLSFWLPNAYMAAAAPVGAMFAIMTKVGIYAILRLTMLLFAAGSGPSAGLGAGLLIGLGMATVVFGMLGVLASQSLGRIAAHAVILSSGTMLAVTGLALAGGGEWMLAGALHYMVASTLAAGALFLMVEPMSRDDGGIAAMLALTAEIYGAKADLPSDDEGPDGPAIAAGPALLAACFALCLLALAGLPPMPGFIGKLTMIQGVFDTADTSPWLGWAFVALLLVSGFATLIGLARIGIQTFWANDDRDSPVMAMEIAPIMALIAVLAVISIESEAVLRYTDRTAQALHQTSRYAQGVLTAPRADDAQPPTPEDVP
ncbi:monovalent cation/H+ antiporter subunit D [Paracoccus marcusii]|uniref:Monovalent cation/H+ antiporter subunit D n=1 Tax=Paracoccus marcusii TaxID=59779 RepID=A0ABY7UP46_9RHOB|nr:monovalent cation/H+ antiporter subunit D [Paracoccus marcusii]WDA11467.1 monovalent cation/H+ antiporter subunit D [Paracoccus marcusii]